MLSETAGLESILVTKNLILTPQNNGNMSIRTIQYFSTPFLDFNLINCSEIVHMDKTPVTGLLSFTVFHLTS